MHGLAGHGGARQLPKAPARGGTDIVILMGGRGTPHSESLSSLRCHVSLKKFTTPRGRGQTRSGSLTRCSDCGGTNNLNAQRRREQGCE